MIRAFQAHQTALGLASDAMSSEARQFDRAFDGLGAAVGEKGAIQSGKLAQALRQKGDVAGSQAAFAEGARVKADKVAQQAEMLRGKK